MTESRLRQYAFVALGAAALLAAFLALTSDHRAILGVDVPIAVPIVLLVLGVAAGAFGAVRKSTLLALVAGALLAAAVAPVGAARPGVLAFGAGLLLGALVLAFVELVHQTTRYTAVKGMSSSDGEGDLDRVTDEALRTLSERAALALGLAAAPIVLALILQAVGPAAWRDALETSSTLGVAVLALALFAGLAIFILARGSTLRSPTREPEAVAVADIEVLE